MKEKTKKVINDFFIIEASILFGVVLLDQISKILAFNFLQDAGTVKVIPFLFNFVYVENEGAAFGALSNALWFLIPITIIALFVFGFIIFKFKNGPRILKVLLAVIMAGAIGNLIDRIARGFVVDFIQFGFWTSFPVFNFADIALIVGVITFGIYFIFFFKDNKSKKNVESDDPVAFISENSVADNNEFEKNNANLNKGDDEK